MKKVWLSLMMVAFVSGCSWLPFWNSSRELKKEEVTQAEDLGVNPYLWQATLAKLNFMPLQTADSKGGVVITEWVKMNESSNESFKITVNILCKELRADGLKVQAFKKSGNEPEENDSRLAAEIERAILIEARNILRRQVAARG